MTQQMVCSKVNYRVVYRSRTVFASYEVHRFGNKAKLYVAVCSWVTLLTSFEALYERLN